MPRIAAALAVVLTVAFCIGFNTVRYPTVWEMTAGASHLSQPPPWAASAPATESEISAQAEPSRDSENQYEPTADGDEYASGSDEAECESAAPEDQYESGAGYKAFDSSASLDESPSPRKKPSGKGAAARARAAARSRSAVAQASSGRNRPEPVADTVSIPGDPVKMDTWDDGDASYPEESGDPDWPAASSEPEGLDEPDRSLSSYNSGYDESLAETKQSEDSYSPPTSAYDEYDSAARQTQPSEDSDDQRAGTPDFVSSDVSAEGTTWDTAGEDETDPAGQATEISSPPERAAGSRRKTSKADNLVRRLPSIDDIAPSPYGAEVGLAPGQTVPIYPSTDKG